MSSPAPKPSPYTTTDADEHLARTNIEHTPLLKNLSEHGQACIDGRSEACAICTPGADAGDLLFLLACTEHLRGTLLSEEEIEMLFDATLARQGKFNMHSDEHTLQQLAEHFQVSLERIKEEVQQPTAIDRTALLAALTDAAYIGCGHLKAMLKESTAGSTAYPSMRPELIWSVFRLFFSKLWEGDARIDYIILEGSHEERAIFNLVCEEPLTDTSVLPMIQPKASDTCSAFVIHADVADYQNKKWLELVERELGFAIDHDQALPWMRSLRQAYLNASAAVLAKGLPLITLPYNAQSGEWATKPAA